MTDMTRFKGTVLKALGGCLAILPVMLAAQVFDGLSLYNAIGSRTTYLKNNAGQTVNSWSSGNNGYMSYLLPDSTVWRMEEYSGSIMRGGPFGGLMQHYDWGRNVTESFLWSDSNHQQHHDFNVMPNGHVLLVSWDRKTEAQARALGRLNISGDIWPDEIVEWDPTGDSVVWEWHFWDHLIQDVDPVKPNYGVVREHPELLDINLGTIQQGGDWTHVNTVDYSEVRDEVVITAHTLHEIYVIDHSTTTAEAAGHTGGRHGRGGDFLYRWGNPQNYDRGTAADQVLFVVHGANWIRPGMTGAGDILMFNNGDRPGSANDYSVVTQVTPPLDSGDHYRIVPDSAFGPRTLTWSYQNGSSFYSQHLGGAYRLPNGNTFAVLGTSGMLHEITPSGQIVWSLNAGGQVGRAVKYARDFTGVEEEKPEPVASGPIAAPNPFPDRTRVRFDLATRARVTLRVYDAGGRLVQTLTEGVQNAGRHEVEFRPRNGTMSEGVYFARLAVDTVGGAPGTTSVKLIMAR